MGGFGWMWNKAKTQLNVSRMLPVPHPLLLLEQQTTLGGPVMLIRHHRSKSQSMAEAINLQLDHSNRLRSKIRLQVRLFRCMDSCRDMLDSQSIPSLQSLHMVSNTSTGICL